MKKVLYVLTAFVLVVCLVGCGKANTTKDTTKKEVKEVTSTNKVITVTPAGDYKAEVSDYYEMVTLRQKGHENDNINYVEIKAADPEDGDLFGYTTTFKNYVAGEEWTLDKLKSDLDENIKEYPNIYSNPRLVKVADIDFYQCDVTTNAEDSYAYFGVLDGKPINISVVGTDIKDSKDVKKILDSIELKY